MDLDGKRQPLDGGQFLFRKMNVFQSAQILLQLCDGTGADQDRSDARIGQQPGKRHLGQALAALLRQGVQAAERFQERGRQGILGQ